MSSGHILVVDDEKHTLQSLEFILEVANFRVNLAESGRSALAQVNTAQNTANPIDLIVADIHLPDLSGFELMDELKAQGFDVPVFIITGYGNRQVEEEARRRGCVGYLPKPIDEEELVRTIRELLAGVQPVE